MSQENLNQETNQNIQQDNIQNEMAQKTIEEMTGKSASTVVNETREILEVYDALQSDDPTKINREMRDTDIQKIKELQEDLEQTNTLAKDLKNLGLGAGQLELTSDKIVDRINEVAAEIENPNGEIAEAEDLLEDAIENNPHLSESKIENMSADELEKHAEKNQSMENQATAPQKEEHLSLLKRLSQKGKDFLTMKAIRNMWANRKNNTK